MDIVLADQHIFVLNDRLTPDDIRQRAMDRRTGAFGSGIGNLLQRPKADDIELVNSQHRLERLARRRRAVYVYTAPRHTIPAVGRGPEATVQARPTHSRPPRARRVCGSTVEHCRD